jgi:hypothetical protein
MEDVFFTGRDGVSPTLPTLDLEPWILDPTAFPLSTLVTRSLRTFCAATRNIRRDFRRLQPLHCKCLI